MRLISISFVAKLFTVLITAACLIPIDAAYASRVHGIFKVVKGKVSIKTAKGKTKRARIGQKVFPKDTIITGKNSRAKVVMIDKNVINVSPDSQILFENYEYDPGKKKKDVLLNVIYGKVRSKVNQRYNGKTSRFQVKTPSAVAGVRGTDFFTSYNSSTRATQVTTFEGKVQYGLPGANGSIVNAVSVSAGQMATVKAGAPPQQPVAVPKSQLANLDASSDADKAPDVPKNEPRQPANGAEPDKKEGPDGEGPNAENGPGEPGQENAEGPQGPGEGRENAEGPAGDREGPKRNADSGGVKVDGPDGAPVPGSIGGIDGPDDAGPEGGFADNGPGLPDSDKGPEPGENRGPANFAPPEGADGSMLLPGDIIGGTDAGDFPTAGDVVGDGFAPPEIIDTNHSNLPDVIPNCEFCDDVVEAGTTQLTIIINN